jgi:alkanesulfonate monooxygenase SsuD/methylene tetrahydromethanopterin reductase-like flavin-dependent oxidoreductase (luciferase family)
MPTPSLKIDGGIPSRLADVPDVASALERNGYDGCWTGEINHDPFLPLLLAAEHTSRPQIGTSVAVAFARNPMTLANLGWDLQTYSQGRFILRAIWSCWQDGTKLRFEGEFYTHRLMTPMFVPEPQPHGFPKVFIAAVGEAMTELCGEVADGVLAHAFTTKRYLDEVTKPTLLRGIERSGRDRGDVAVGCPVFVVTGEDEAEWEAAATATRNQIAFYGSTPAYRKVLELHGWGDLQTELHRLSRQGDWDTMGAIIDDDVLDTFAVVAPVDKLAAALRARCDGVIDRVMPAFTSVSATRSGGSTKTMTLPGC